jgi:hypothetical protein
MGEEVGTKCNFRIQGEQIKRRRKNEKEYIYMYKKREKILVCVKIK